MEPSGRDGGMSSTPVVLGTSALADDAAEPAGWPGEVDVSAFLRLDSLGARLMIVLFAAVHFAISSYGLDTVTHPIFSYLALTEIVAAAAVLTLPARDPFPIVPTLVVVGLCGLCSLHVWNLPDSGWPGWSTWVWGAVTCVAYLLSLRGRTGFAWFAFALMTAITIHWCIMVGRGPMEGIGFVIRSAGLLLVVSLFATLLKRTARSINRVQQADRERTIASATAAATMDEQNRRLEVLRKLATPPLRRIVSADPLDAETRRDFALEENALRDLLRATGLVRPTITEAVRAARIRGVTVTLLDDSGDSPLERAEWAGIETTVLTELNALSWGSIVVRLSPPGRAELATIIVDGDSGFKHLALPAAATAE